MTVSPAFMKAALNCRKPSSSVNNFPALTAEQARRVQTMGSRSFVLNPVLGPVVAAPVVATPAADLVVDDQVDDVVDNETFRDAFDNNILTTYAGAMAILSQLDLADMFPEDEMSSDESEVSCDESEMSSDESETSPSPNSSRFLRDGTTPRRVTLPDLGEVIETADGPADDNDVEQSVAELLGLAFLAHPDFGCEEDVDVEDEMEVDDDSSMDFDCDESMDIDEQTDSPQSQ